MDFKDYLKTNQKIVYDTFTFALRSGHVSHAYLIKGNEGAPLLETAKFLAKTLVFVNLYLLLSPFMLRSAPPQKQR